jgi:hypothetical protein
MNDSETLSLVLRSTFIFTGTITASGASSLRIIPPGPELAVARFERGIRVNPMLGDLTGRPITVRLAKGAQVRYGERLLFFANSWVHGEEIAVAEVTHLPADEKTERDVSETFESLPERHLNERIQAAVIIVRGVATHVAHAGIREPITEHSADWMKAVIEIHDTLKGEAPSRAGGGRKRGEEKSREKETLDLFFPSSFDKAWRDHPKIKASQAGVFLLHRGRPPVPPEGFVAPDPADVQPENEAEAIRRRIAGRAR